MAFALGGVLAPTVGVGPATSQDDGAGLHPVATDNPDIDFEASRQAAAGLGRRGGGRTLVGLPLNVDYFTGVGPTPCFSDGMQVDSGAICTGSVRLVNTSAAELTSIRLEYKTSDTGDGLYEGDPTVGPIVLSLFEGSTPVAPGGEIELSFQLVARLAAGSYTDMFTVTAESDGARSILDSFSITYEVIETPPSVPTNVVLTVSPGALVFSWDPPVHDGGTAVTGYYVTLEQRSSDPLADGSELINSVLGCNFTGRPDLTLCDIPNNDLTSIEPGEYVLGVKALSEAFPSPDRSPIPYNVNTFYTDVFTLTDPIGNGPAQPSTTVPTTTVPTTLPTTTVPTTTAPTTTVPTTTVPSTTTAPTTTAPTTTAPTTTAPSATVTPTTAAPTTAPPVELPPLPTPQPPAPPAAGPDPGAPATASETYFGSIADASSISELLAATDYKQDEHGEILRLYRAIFNREPDLPGAKYWIDEIYEGLGRSILEVTSFIATDDQREFRAAYAGITTNSGFVDRIYRNMLGRPPELEGFLYWVDQMNNGLSRADTARFVALSPEFVERFPYQARGRLAIVSCNASAERVVIINMGAAPVTLDGHILHDGIEHRLDLDTVGGSLAPGAALTIVSGGSAIAGEGEIVGWPNNVWDTTADTAYLFSPSGQTTSLECS